MKLAVIGATSRTGRHLLAEAVRRGHTVVPFTRRPSELADTLGLAAPVTGEGTNVEDLRRAIRGQDAVISIIAAPDLRASRVVSQVTRATIEAMRAENVQRLVTTGSRSIGATRPAFGLAMVWAFMRNVYADLVRAETYVEESGLDWTIVRATRLTDGRRKGRYHADFEPDQTGGGVTLSRADYADALLDAIENRTLIKRTVGVNGPDRSSAVRALAAPPTPPELPEIGS